jgi:hypothetical protein
VKVQSFTPRRGVSRLRRRSTIRSACKARWYPPFDQDFRCGHTNLVILKSLSHKLVGGCLQPQTCAPKKRSTASIVRYDSRALCSSPFAASRYWEIGRRRRSAVLRSLYYPGICARCKGSLPGWGCLASSSIRACRPDRGPGEQGGAQAR